MSVGQDGIALFSLRTWLRGNSLPVRIFVLPNVHLQRCNQPKSSTIIRQLKSQCKKQQTTKPLKGQSTSRIEVDEVREIFRVIGFPNIYPQLRIPSRSMATLMKRQKHCTSHNAESKNNENRKQLGHRQYSTIELYATTSLKECIETHNQHNQSTNLTHKSSLSATTFPRKVVSLEHSLWVVKLRGVGKVVWSPGPAPSSDNQDRSSHKIGFINNETWKLMENRQRVTIELSATTSLKQTTKTHNQHNNSTSLTHRSPFSPMTFPRKVVSLEHSFWVLKSRRARMVCSSLGNACTPHNPTTKQRTKKNYNNTPVPGRSGQTQQ